MVRKIKPALWLGLVRRYVADGHGATTTEYALIAATVGVAMLAGINALGAEASADGMSRLVAALTPAKVDSGGHMVEP